jgi:CubicO group peptidase (beta-lactamase class C family)
MERSPDWVKFVLDGPMSSAPGDTFNYSNGNAHLISAILTKLTGMSALEYARAKLFGPLGIIDLSWEHDPQGISNGGKGLYLQARDMAKIGCLFLHDGAWEGKQLLPSNWTDEVTRATVNPRAPGEPELRYSNRLVLGEGQPAEEWRLTFDGEKLKVRAKLVDGSEISVDGETSG